MRDEFFNLLQFQTVVSVSENLELQRCFWFSLNVCVAKIFMIFPYHPTAGIRTFVLYWCCYVKGNLCIEADPDIERHWSGKLQRIGEQLSKTFKT